MSSTWMLSTPGALLFFSLYITASYFDFCGFKIFIILLCTDIRESVVKIYIQKCVNVCNPSFQNLGFTCL
jgi:hypothetical protein